MIKLHCGEVVAHIRHRIQSLLLQIHTDILSADIAFGYGSSAAFTENLRIKGNGNVGMCMNPSFKLDIADRMRIRSGEVLVLLELYFNRSDNSQVGGFVGMQDDAHVGF